MKNSFFKHAAKRFLSSFTFMTSLVVLAALLCLSFFAFMALGYRECGVALSDGDENALAVANALVKKGFILYGDREKMISDAQYGKIDCGALILPGLTERMEEGKMEDCAVFYVSEASGLGTLYREQLSAAIFNRYAPYMAIDEMEKLNAFPGEGAVMKEYEGYFLNEKVFGFNVSLTEGHSQTASGGAKTAAAAIAVFTFAASLFGTVSIYGEDMMKFTGALGKTRALKYVILPACLLQTVFTAVSVAAGLIAAYILGAKEAMGLLAPALAYTAVLQAAGVFLCLFFKKTQTVIVFLTYQAIAALAVCPVFADIAAIAPWLRYIRPAVIPYWFYYMLKG